MKSCRNSIVGAVRVTTLVFLGLLLCLGGSRASAQELEVPSQEVAGLQQTILGLGVAYVPDYDGSNDYKYTPLIQARWNWASGRYISFLGNTLRADVIPGKQIAFGPALRYRMERDDVDDSEVDKMSKVDAAFEVGAFADVAVVERLHLTVQLTQDISDAYGGILLDLGAAYNMPLQKKAIFTLFVSSTYASTNYMTTYFSVNNQNRGSSTLPDFNASSGFKDVGGGGLLQYNLNEKWGILAAFKYSRLLGDAEKSPVVKQRGDANQYITGVAANYRF